MNSAPHSNVFPPEETTPQAVLEHFIANFYEAFKGDNPAGQFTALRNMAVESAWQRGLMRGMQDGYDRALCDMKIAQMQGWEAVQGLLNKAG